MYTPIPFATFISQYLRSSPLIMQITILWEKRKRLTGGPFFIPGLLLLCAIPWWCHQMGTFSALLTLCQGNPLSPMDSPNKGQWRGALRFSLNCAWPNGWANTRDVGDLRRHMAHFDVTVIHGQNQLYDHRKFTTVYITSRGCWNTSLTLWILSYKINVIC